MEKRTPAVAVAAVMLLLAVVIGGANAIDLCGMDQKGLDTCKPYVTADPPPPAVPSAACCQALSAANLPCLCSYRNSFMLPSLGIDPTLALALPAKCNLATPSNC